MFTVNYHIVFSIKVHPQMEQSSSSDKAVEETSTDLSDSISENCREVYLELAGKTDGAKWCMFSEMSVFSTHY